MAPGPSVAEQTPALTGQPPVDLGHEGRRLLVADQDVANRGPGERIGEVDILLTGDAEHTGDSFVLEAPDEEFSGPSSSLGHKTDRSESRRGLKAAAVTSSSVHLDMMRTGSLSTFLRGPSGDGH